MTTIASRPAYRRIEPPALSGAAWAKLGLLAAAFVAIFYNNLFRLWVKTNPIWGDPNWSHAVCVPIIGLYYLYLHRDELLATRTEPVLMGAWNSRRWLAAGVMTLGLGMYLLAARDVENYGYLAGIGVVTIGVGVAAPLLTGGQPLRRNVIAVGLAVVGVLLYFFGPLLLPATQAFVNIRGALTTAGLGVLILAAFVQLLDAGLGVMLFGLLTSAFGIWPGQNDQVWDLGMIITLFGTVLTLCGWRVMRIAWFPIVFLICALPWPPIIYSAVASPLQVLAARVAVVVLQIGGVTADFAGTKIFIDVPSPDPALAAKGVMVPHTLSVEEACAGLRSLMTFITVGAAWAFLTPRPLWQRMAITFSAIPIAIFCNVMRVSGQGLLDRYWSAEASQGFTHQFVGMVMLIPAFFLIWLVAWIVDQLFLEETDAKKPTGLNQNRSAIKTARGVA